MDREKYYERIGIAEKQLSADLKTLKYLQKQHLLNIPFENLDIHRKKTIILDLPNFYKKIVTEKRGGFCYELNGLFYFLLRETGFQSKMISAGVSQTENTFGAEYDHLAILTKIEEKEFLVDVGFGDFSAEPLEIVLDKEQNDRNGVFLIRKFDEEYFEVCKKDNENFQSEYIFKDLPRELTEFSEMCKFHQTSSESHFTKGKVVSIMTGKGRKTLTDKQFLITENGKKTIVEITSEEEFNRLLEQEFDISKNS